VFAEEFSFSKVRELNMPVPGFHPFPKCSEREAWEAAAPETAAEWIIAAEKLLEFQWPAVTAKLCLEPRFSGEFMPHNRRFRERRNALGTLAFAECFEGRGRFLLQIISGIISICEETSWITPLAFASIGFDIANPDDHEVDLSSSETAALLALTDYLLGSELDQISSRVRRRIRSAVNERIILPYLNRDDYWWMGFEKGHRINNWNPWCNLNALICFLLLCENETLRSRGLHKILMSLDRYLETYAGDGCCDEGPMYWGAAGAGLFECLELAKSASGGVLDAMKLEKLRLIGEYITKVYIDGKYYVNYADGDAIVTVGSSVHRFGKALENEGMMALGAKGEPIRPIAHDWFHAYAFLNEIFSENERAECSFALPYPMHSWFWEKQVMIARENEGSPKGLFLSAKAGRNDESHNHNDIGNFIVYTDGKPLFIDIGTEEYVAQTFSPKRYELWNTQSQYHNCPGVRGILQRAGGEYKATRAFCEITAVDSRLSMELAGAYPEEAGIISLKREARLIRGENPCVCIEDSFILEEETDDIHQYFMTSPKPEIKESGLISLEGSGASLRFDGNLLQASVYEIPITESRLHWNWGDFIYRIDLKAKEPSKRLLSKVSISLEGKR
jgi:hypothetical protein